MEDQSRFSRASVGPKDIQTYVRRNGDSLAIQQAIYNGIARPGEKCVKGKVLSLRLQVSSIEKASRVYFFLALTFKSIKPRLFKFLNNINNKTNTFKVKG